MSVKRLLYLLPIMFLFSCIDEFKVNADWKDITVVYGLIDAGEDDSVHYVRITKGFTNEGANASDIAKNHKDSIYHSDSLYVVLQRWKDDKHILPNIVLYRVADSTKKLDGDFYGPEQYLYRTEKGVRLYRKSTYKLIITNTVTGKVVSAQTTLIHDLNQIIPVKTSMVIHFDTSKTTKVLWEPGENAFFYNIDVNFRYIEYPKGQINKRELKEITFPVAKFYKTNTFGSDMEVEIEGKRLFEVIADNIRKDPQYRNYVREFADNGIDISYFAGGKEIFYYLNVNQPSIGIVEKKPEYSNIENGYGVFSCRNQFKFTRDLSSLAKEYLMTSDDTYDLNFTE